MEHLNQETQERLASPLEQKIINLSPEERQELLQDALDKYNELEQLIHTITGLENGQDTLWDDDGFSYANRTLH